MFKRDKGCSKLEADILICIHSQVAWQQTSGAWHFLVHQGILSRIWNSWVLCFMTVLPQGWEQNQVQASQAHGGSRKAAGSAWCLRWADSGVFASFRRHPDPGSEAACLHPVLWILLLSILWFMVWVQFSTFLSSFLSLPSLLALSRLLFITR